jgi:hypothetical protein
LQALPKYVPPVTQVALANTEAPVPPPPSGSGAAASTVPRAPDALDPPKVVPPPPGSIGAQPAALPAVPEPVKPAAPPVVLPATQVERIKPEPVSPDAPGPLPSPIKGATAAPVAGPAGDLNNLYRLAVERYASMDSYIVRLTRREQVKGKRRPVEVLAYRFRKNPWSVSAKWIGDEARGREIIYVRGHYGDKVHLAQATGDVVPVSFGNRRLSLPADSAPVRALGRRPLSDYAIGALVAQFGLLKDAVERNDTRKGSVKYLGQLRRPECEQPVEAVLHAIPAGVEPDLPHGGQRWWFFDTELHLPTIIVTCDEHGDEVEYYWYSNFLIPPSGQHLDENLFNPDLLGQR